MKCILKRTLTSAAVAAVLAAPMAHATNGYFKIGSGTKNKGMAGAGIAFGQDSLAGAMNPAVLAKMGTRVDGGLEIFKPKRKGQVDATGMAVPDLGGAGPRQGQNSSEKSRANWFAIPNFGFSKAWSNKITFGMSVTGNGGMNTRYGDNQAGSTPGGGNIYTDAFAPVIGDTSSGNFQPGPSGFAGFLEVGPAGVPASVMDPNLANLYMNPNTTPTLGVNLSQALIAPTIAYRITEHHSIGFAPVIGFQSFRAYGLGLFQAFSSDPGKVTNNGNDTAWGVGARVGYQGDFGMFSFGLTGTSKIYMDKFDDYAGLFAEKGDFDIPATFGGGIAVRFTPKLTLAADISRILYGDVKAISNKGPTANEFFGAFTGALVGDPSLNARPLGTNNGYGFGWDDITVYKVGVNYDYNTAWSFRAGFNYAEMPYDKDQALFNVLAPAVVEKHATVGFSYRPSKNGEISVAYMHAFDNDVEYTYVGSGAYTGFSYKARNRMYQNSIEASYGWTF